MGIVFREQLTGEGADRAARYVADVGWLLHGPWEATRRRVLCQRPWWGEYINGRRRKAAAAEPRPRLRLMADSAGSTGQDGFELDSLSVRPSESGWPGRIDDFFVPIGPGERQLIVDPHDVRPLGLVLPDHLRGPVGETRLLPVPHCTPDLPPRVGVDEDDRETYTAVLDGRDQKTLPTCAGFAAVFALEVAARRADLQALPRLSPAWLHLATGDASREGRALREIVDCLRRRGVPCSEDALPYQRLRNGSLARFADLSADIHRDQATLARLCPSPEIVPVPHDDVFALKALLAAGWWCSLGRA